MPRVSTTPPPAEPQGSPNHSDAPFYRYDPGFGDPKDPYTRADVAHPDARGPEVPGRFVAYVEGETVINTMHGRRIVTWKAEPGTLCMIRGYWADGTVHLQWPAIVGNYRVDGRFPAWVVARDPTAVMAGGGRILEANDPPVRRPGLSTRLARPALLVLVVLVLLALPPTRDALASLASELLHVGR